MSSSNSSARPADVPATAGSAPAASPAGGKPYAYRPLAVTGRDFETLRDLIDTLLSEQGGCPWDKEQTLVSLCQLFPMEVAEVREAALTGDRERVFEELGDCLMLLLLLLAKAQNGDGGTAGAGGGPIDAAEALKQVGEKIIRRHTWIFGGDKAASPEEVERLWEVNKRREKAAGSAGLKGLGESLGGGPGAPAGGVAP